MLRSAASLYQCILILHTITKGGKKASGVGDREKVGFFPAIVSGAVTTRQYSEKRRVKQLERQPSAGILKIKNAAWDKLEQ